MVAIATLAFMSSCSQDEVSPLDKGGISSDVKEKLLNASFDISDLKAVDRVNPLTNEREVGYMIEGDMFLPSSQLDEVVNAEINRNPAAEQYRTSALVNNNRTYSVIGYTGSGFALTNKMRTGLQWAVNNYNRLNIGISFSLSFSASTSADMVVYNNGQSGGGGSAGFPSGGAPNKFIQINAGTDGFSTNVNEHVICHEMGHSIGFRHSDYMNRSNSCGTGGNEGSAGVGAIYIPGTPGGNGGIDQQSIMLACFSNSADGEFSSGDITALEFLY